MRLWLLDQVGDVKSAIKSLICVLVERADNEKDYRLPGYTHLQVFHLGSILHLNANVTIARTTHQMVTSIALLRIILEI